MTAAVLYGLGARGFHHRQFELFIAVVLGLAVLIVLAFVLTSTDGAEE